MDKQIILETELCFNKMESDYALKHGFDSVPGSHLFVIENCRKKERRNIDKGFVDSIQEDIGNIKNQYPEKVVLSIVQFKKGLPKTKEQQKKLIECGKFQDSDGVCLYESNPLQSYNELALEISFLKGESKGYNRYFVLEMDGLDILEKVNLLLKEGIRNFVLIAGDYNNINLWNQVLISSILRNGGKSIVVLPSRMNTKTKKSFIEKISVYGPSIIVHGMPFGGGSGENRFLDHVDMVYKIKSSLPSNHRLITDIQFQNLYNLYKGNARKQYELGRVCSMIEGRLFCENNRRAIVFQT